MYIGRSLFLKLFLFAIVLSVHENNVNAKVISPYGSQTSTRYPDPEFKKERQQSLDENRVDFQVRNHRGPGTYIFGFDTGHGKNRQYRMEERLRDGSVRGRYGFYDPRGKLRIIGYVAGPNSGYQERHHETITYKKSET